MVLALGLAEDAGGRQLKLHHVAFDVIGKHDRQPLAEPACAALTLAASLDVLWALRAVAVLGVGRCGIRLVAVRAPAIRTRRVFRIVLGHVERATDLGRSSDDHHVEEALVHGSDLLPVDQQAEHTALDRDTLARRSTASDERLGNVGEFTLDERGDIPARKQSDVAH